MASGYTALSASVRVDLDDIFVPRFSGSASVTNYKVGSSDLNQRYEPLTAGWQRLPFDTEMKVSGTDLADLFRGQITPTPTPTVTVTVTPTRTPTITPSPSSPPTTTTPPPTTTTEAPVTTTEEPTTTTEEPYEGFAPRGGGGSEQFP